MFVLACVAPVRVVVTGSFLVKETRVPIHESSMRGLVRIYTYVFGGVIYVVSVAALTGDEKIPNC